MKLETKLKNSRKEWIHWLLNGDEVNGSIDPKFEGIINHALEDHSFETIKEIKKRVRGRLQSMFDSGFDDEDEIMEHLFD